MYTLDMTLRAFCVASLPQFAKVQQQLIQLCLSRPVIEHVRNAHLSALSEARRALLSGPPGVDFFEMSGAEVDAIVPRNTGVNGRLSTPSRRPA